MLSTSLQEAAMFPSISLLLVFLCRRGGPDGCVAGSPRCVAAMDERTKAAVEWGVKRRGNPKSLSLGDQSACGLAYQNFGEEIACSRIGKVAFGRHQIFVGILNIETKSNASQIPLTLSTFGTSCEGNESNSSRFYDELLTRMRKPL